MLIDGELPAARELRVRWHLDLCVPCARRAAALAALKRGVGRIGEPDVPTPSLRRTVHPRVRP